MATIAFFYEALTLLVVGLLFVSFVRGIQGVPVPSAARRKHSGPLTGLSVVLLIEPNVDPEHAVASLQAQKYPKLDLVIVLSDGAGLEERTRSGWRPMRACVSSRRGVSRWDGRVRTRGTLPVFVRRDTITYCSWTPT